MKGKGESSFSYILGLQDVFFYSLKCTNIHKISVCVLEGEKEETQQQVLKGKAYGDIKSLYWRLKGENCSQQVKAAVFFKESFKSFPPVLLQFNSTGSCLCMYLCRFQVSNHNV